MRHGRTLRSHSVNAEFRDAPDSGDLLREGVQPDGYEGRQILKRQRRKRKGLRCVR